MLAPLLLACASLVGIDQLDALPDGFPLQLVGEPGHITRSPTGQVAVDVAHAEADDARGAWQAMIAQAEAAGFQVSKRDVHRKRQRVTLEGPQGRLELSCCAQRADRRHLAFVSWWAPAD